MSNRCPLLAQIHIAKKDLATQLGMDDDSYRAALVVATQVVDIDTGEIKTAGKDSSGKMSEAERRRVIEHFKSLGWKPKRNYRKAKPDSEKTHYSKSTSRKIIALWNDLHKAGKVRDKSNAAMHRWLANNSGTYKFIEDSEGKKKRVQTSPGKQHPDWLTPAESNAVIKALNAWLAR